MDENDVICWTTSPDHIKYGKDFGNVQNQISHWESLCNRLFSEKEAFDYKSVLAEGYARMLDAGDDEDANKIIKNTSHRIKLQGEQILKENYLIASLAATLLVIVLLVVFVLLNESIIRLTSRNIYELFLVGYFGGIGAFISTMIRAQSYHPELSAGRKIHQIDGILRIIYGLLAGVIISLGIKANILIGFVDSIDKNIFILCFLGAISGASEMLLPNIIKQFDSDKLINKQG